MSVRTLPPFTIRPDIDQPREHEERNRGVHCTGCARTTWAVHAVCDSCIDRGRFYGECECVEGRRARGER